MIPRSDLSGLLNPTLCKHSHLPLPPLFAPPPCPALPPALALPPPGLKRSKEGAPLSIRGELRGSSLTSGEGRFSDRRRASEKPRRTVPREERREGETPREVSAARLRGMASEGRPRLSYGRGDGGKTGSCVAGRDSAATALGVILFHGIYRPGRSVG